MKPIPPITLGILTAVAIGAVAYLHQSDDTAESPSLLAFQPAKARNRDALPAQFPVATASPSEHSVSPISSKPPQAVAPAPDVFPSASSVTSADRVPVTALVAAAEFRKVTGPLPPSRDVAANAAPQISAIQAPAIVPGAAPAVDLIVPRGAILPATLVDPGTAITQPQADALDRVADDFLQVVTAPEAPVPPPVTPSQKPRGAPPGQPDGWDEATRQADERYRQIFGQEAYNARTSQAAGEALREK